jgi:ribosomal protein S17
VKVGRKKKIGIVSAANSAKTITVKISGSKKNLVIGKMIKFSKKLKAHD